jgi:hypothetical protein
MFQEDIGLVHEIARKVAKEEIAAAFPKKAKAEVKAEVEPDPETTGSEATQFKKQK